jgi:hypothetical protein
MDVFDQFVVNMRQRDYAKIVDEWDADADVPSPAARIVHLRNYALALLRVGDISRANATFEGIVASQKKWDVADDYINLGAIGWIKNAREFAVESWRRATVASYGDNANNIAPGLLLYYAGVRARDRAWLDEATKYIESKLKTGWSRNWPAPLGRYLVGNADEAHVLEELFNQPPQRQPDEFCRWDFYRGVKLSQQGDEDGFFACMRSAVDRPDQITWTAEFVLARHELGETPNPGNRLSDNDHE